jgi:hypothetical protein
MKLRYSKSIPEQPMEFVELRRRCVRALDRNRNQRQATALLVHYALALREDAAVMREQSVQARLTGRSEFVRLISRSFCILARTESALEQWRKPEIVWEFFPKRSFGKDKIAPQADNSR